MCTSELKVEHPDKMSKFLSRFSSLKTLDIWFSDTIVTQAYQDDPHRLRKHTTVFEGRMYANDSEECLLHHFVKKQLLDLTNTLEELTMNLSMKDCEDRTYAEVLDHSDYSSFTKLCHLGIPHFLLTGDFIELPDDWAGKILPPTLEELVITHIDEMISNIWDIIDGISFARRQHGGFPKLRRVKLDSEGRPIVKFYIGGSVISMRQRGIEVEALIDDSDGN